MPGTPIFISGVLTFVAAAKGKLVATGFVFLGSPGM